MKGLLLKDIFTLAKQLKFFLLIILIWSLIPNFSASCFAIVYAALLPVSALAYDERSKWNTLAAMMPYSKKDIVLSKYLLGYILVGIVSAVSVISKIILLTLGSSATDKEDIAATLAIMLVATVFSSINLPFMFKMGVEKGRLIYFILVFALVAGGMAAFNITDFELSNSSANVFSAAIICITATVLINVASIIISLKVYNNKD